MTHTQKSNCILMWVICCIILGGVCFEKVQADSFFTWGSAQVVADLVSGQEETMEESLCTGRILKGSLESRILKAEKEDQTRMLERAVWGLAFVGLLPQISALSLGTVGRSFEESRKSHTVIIRFIHTQDGAKE